MQRNKSQHQNWCFISICLQSPPFSHAPESKGLSTLHTLQRGFCDPLSYAASGISNAPHTAVEARNNSNLSECFPGKRPLGQRNKYEQPAQEHCTCLYLAAVSKPHWFSLLMRGWIIKPSRLSHPMWAPNMLGSLQEAGNIPVDIVFVPSKAQQDHSPAHPGVLEPPWFPQKEDFPRQVDSALGWCIPNTSHPVVGGPASVWQPCNPHEMWLQHKGLQCSPWKPVLWGYLQRVSFYSLKEKRKVKTTSTVRSSNIVLTPGFLTREEDIQDMANVGFVL